MKTISVTEIRNVWVAWTNTDLTEGRGASIPLAICEVEATARRLGKGKSVQGCDCVVTPEEAFYHNGRWYGPVEVIAPNSDDRYNQGVIDRRNAAAAKARAAGLSEDEIKDLRA